MKVKSKWSGAAFLMLALALVAGLVIVAAPTAPPAAAEDLAWSSVEGDFPLHGLPPGVGQIIDVDVQGNTVYVLADDGLVANEVQVQRSDDGGYRWEPKRDITLAATGTGVAIAMSPSYTTDGTVMVLGDDGIVYASTDKGVTWNVALETTGFVGVVPSSLAVSPTFNALESGGQIVVGGAWDGTACTWYETWQGPTVGWSATWTPIPSLTPANCLAVEYASTSSLRLMSVQVGEAASLESSGNATAGWTNAEAFFGTYSAKLVDGTGAYEEARVKVPYGDALNTLTNAGLQFYVKATSNMAAILSVDTDGDGDVDVVLHSTDIPTSNNASWAQDSPTDSWGAKNLNVANPTYTGKGMWWDGDGWDETTAGSDYDGDTKTASNSGYFTLATWKAGVSGSGVDGSDPVISVGAATVGSGTGTFYVDDITIDSVVYPLDPATYGATGSLSAGWPALAAGNLPTLTSDGADLVHLGAATGAVIAQPDDYNPISTGACPNCPMYFFVGTWGAAASSTFWFDTAIGFVDLKAASTLAAAHYATSGLVADGTYARATLITGCYSFPITYNCDVRSLSWGAPVFIEGNGGPIGAVGVLLAYTGSGNTVYAATADFVGGYTPGDLCCVSRSDDFAASWGDTCLTSEDFYQNVNDMVWLDSVTGLVVCDDGTWQSTFKTWDKGLSWKRVDRWQDVTAVALAPDGTIVLLDTGTTGDKVLVSTDNGETFAATAADPPTLVTQQMRAIAAGSATDIFVGDISGHVYTTNDGGATWTDHGALGSQIYSMEVPDGYADAPYVAAGMVSSTGMMEILVSSDAGASWAQWGSGSTQAAGWGASVGYIGAKFSPTFDGAADSLLYVHTVGATYNDVYRADLGATTETWVRTGCNPAAMAAVPIPAIDLVYIPSLDGVDGMTGNALYVCICIPPLLAAAPGATPTPSPLSPFGQGGLMRGTWNPELVTAMEPYVGLWRADSITAVDAANLNPFAVIADTSSFWARNGVMDLVYSDAGVDVFTVDWPEAVYPLGLNLAPWAPVDRVRNWIDTAGFLTPVATTWPADGAIVPSNNTATGEPVQLQWMPVVGAWSYDVMVVRDPLKLSRIVFMDSVGAITLPSGAVAPAPRSPARTAAMQCEMSIPVGTLTDGATYYWWVRVAQHAGSTPGTNDHQGPWCDARSFTVEAVEMHAAPDLISPASGATDIGIKPLFKWSGVEDATGYTLLVDDDPAFASPVIDESLGVQQTYQPAVALDYETTYSWRVVASGADWTSPAADGIFTTIPSWAEPAPEATPAWIWVIIVLGAVLAIAVIVLIVRTRRAV